MRAKPDIYHPIYQQQCWPLQLLCGNKGGRPAGGLDYHRAAKLFLSRGDTQRMESVHIARVLPETSLVLATTYNVPVEASITGVLVIPNSGVMVEQSFAATSAHGIAVIPLAGLIKLACHTGVDETVSASQAYTLLCSVATNTRL